MPEYVKEYFSSALDFAGDEQGDIYRQYCVIQFGGVIALNIIVIFIGRIVSLFGGALLILSFYLYVINMVGMVALTFPNIAATVRRARTLKRSKWWAAGIVFFPIPIVPIAWWVLGKDIETIW